MGLSSKNFETPEFTPVFETVMEAGPLVLWAGWGPPGDESTGSLVVATLGGRTGFMPVIQTGVFGAGSKELFRSLTLENRDESINSMTSFAAEFQVPYSCFGVESNSHFEHDPGSFAVSVNMFDRACDVVPLHTDRPIAITETGWPHSADIPGWEADEAEQARSVERFYELTASLETRMLIWLWPY